jgi:hypothetical protein
VDECKPLARGGRKTRGAGVTGVVIDDVWTGTSGKSSWWGGYNGAPTGGESNSAAADSDSGPGIDLHRFDGLALRLRGDGQRYKVRLWTGDPPPVTPPPVAAGTGAAAAEENAAAARPPGAQEYQCAFDTVVGRWSEVGAYTRPLLSST